MVTGECWASAPIATPPAADRWGRYRRAIGSAVFVALGHGPALLARPVRHNLLRLADRARRSGCTLVVHWGDAEVTGHRGAAQALQRAGAICFGGHRTVDACGPDPDLRYLDALLVAEQLDTLVYIDGRDGAAGDGHPCQLNVDLAALTDEVLDAIEQLCRSHGNSPAVEPLRALVVTAPGTEHGAAYAALAAAGLETLEVEARSAAALAETLDALQQSGTDIDVVAVLDERLAVWPSSLDVPLVRWVADPATARRPASAHDDLICVGRTDGLAELLVRRPDLRLALPQTAAAALRALLEDGSCARSRLRLGERHLERGAVVAAAEQFLAAARIDPLTPQAYNGLGMCSFAQGDLLAARRAFSAALRIAPGYEPALANLAALEPLLVDAGPNRPSATVVIPAWNAWEHTRECLVRLVSTIEAGDSVVVTDNGSSDGTAAGLAADFPWVRVERLARNLGFASGCNIGAAAASGDVVVFLNNDTIPTQDWLARLLRPFDDGAVVATGPRSNFVSGPQCVPDASYLPGGTVALDSFVRRWQADHDGATEPVERLVGFCLAVRREAFFAIGAFDERFGIGSYEDDDLCRRLREDGGTLLMVHDSFVHHHGHATFSANGVDWAALERHNRELYRAKASAA